MTDAAIKSHNGTALLVVDMQSGVVVDSWNATEITARVAGLVDRARRADVPVVWVQHFNEDLIEGSDDWRIAAPLLPLDTERIVGKHYGDSFEDTILMDILTDLGVKHLVVCGAQSDACIISTLFGGFVRGYSMTLVSDAHTTEDRSHHGVPTPDAVIPLINRIWQHRNAPGRRTGVVTADSVVFSSSVTALECDQA